MPHETNLMWEAFEIYSGLDPNIRSIDRSYQYYILKHSLTHEDQTILESFRKWCRENDWVKRARDLDTDKLNSSRTDKKFLKKCHEYATDLLEMNYHLATLAYDELVKKMGTGEITAQTLVNIFRNSQEELRTNSAYVANIGLDIQETSDGVGGLEAVDEETGEKLF